MLETLPISRRTWLKVSTLSLAALGAPGLLRAGDGAATSCGKRVGDQLWVVSTRGLSCGFASSPSLPPYHVQYFAQGTWHASDAAGFFAQADPALTTVYYVHGNRYEQHDAIYSGWQVYRALTAHLNPDQHLRLVVWSWPSEMAAVRPVRDAREKASRTGVEGLFLARFLASSSPDVPTGMIAYSFGARVALGAVHLTAGGALEGRVLLETPPTQAQYRLAILAGGAEADGLAPGGLFDQTLSRTEELLNLYNTCDPALKHFRAIDKCTRPAAMGYAGVLGLVDRSKITERNVAGIVGRSHDEQRYFHSPSIMSQTRATLVKP